MRKYRRSRRTRHVCIACSIICFVIGFWTSSMIRSARTALLRSSPPPAPTQALPVKRKPIIVSAGKNGTWMYDMGYPVILCSTETPACKKDDSHGRDGQSLTHLVLHYWDELEHIRIALIHGGLNEWHQPKPFKDILRRAIESPKPFIHLGLQRNYKKINFDETGWCDHAWRPYIGECPHQLCVAQGLQFVANGELFKWLPKHKWEQLRDIGYGRLAPEEFHLPNDPWLGIDYMFEWMIFPLAQQEPCPPVEVFY